MKGHGPYDTAAQALADAAALTAAIRAADPGHGPMTDAVRAARLKARTDYLTRALAAAGVELGAYDRRIAAWLADWEAETLQVLVGWIERARLDQAPGDVDPAAAELAQDFDDPSLLEVHAAGRRGDAVCGALEVITTRVYGDVTCEACRLMVAPLVGETVHYRPAPRRVAGACGRIASPERITSDPSAVTCQDCRTALGPAEPPSTGGRLAEGSE